DVGDSTRAQRVIETALRDDPGDADLLAELERLAATTGGWRDAAEALALATGGSAADIAPATRAELAVKRATWLRNRLEDRRGAEDAFHQALAADPENVDVLRSIEDLQR